MFGEIPSQQRYLDSCFQKAAIHEKQRRAATISLQFDNVCQEIKGYARNNKLETCATQIFFKFAQRYISFASMKEKFLSTGSAENF